MQCIIIVPYTITSILSPLVKQRRKRKLFSLSLLFIIYYLLKNRNKKARRDFVNIIEKGMKRSWCLGSVGKGGRTTSSQQYFLWPLGIAYNNIQITYRNTSLKSSSKENHVCDLLTDGTENMIEKAEPGMGLGGVWDACSFRLKCVSLKQFPSRCRLSRIHNSHREWWLLIPCVRCRWKLLQVIIVLMIFFLHFVNFKLC